MFRKTILCSGLFAVAALYFARPVETQSGASRGAVLFEGARLIPGDGKPAVAQVTGEALPESFGGGRVSRQGCHRAIRSRAGTTAFIERTEKNRPRGLFALRGFVQTSRYESPPRSCPSVVLRWPTGC